MMRIRIFEETVNEKFLAGEIPGFVHLYIGEEAVATAVCHLLEESDYITSTHRGHGHTIAKGADLNRMMAELYGKRTGYCKGKGGSMHIADFKVGMLGANGVVGGGINLAVGAALASKLEGNGRVAASFFGDGASNRGTFHEGLNMAAVWNLPVIFVCENNQWSSTTFYRDSTAVEDVAVRASSYNMLGLVADGNDIFDVYEKAREAVDRARSGGGPSLLEAKTYRMKGHFVGDPEKYRRREEVMEQLDKNDPIKRFVERVTGEGRVARDDLNRVDHEVLREVGIAVQFAQDSPFPEPSEAFEELFVEVGAL
ncbi:thiamine pyrophosphate-dependent dehydrogenase E1 component subunit alpha [Alicyclobacillus fastidiosus]|uniref:Thiamine pyrophosphate-dependent dehydrogenase E1 component subunit alpha n=1 Tax=Alicyclobacillus fastidiosus TaxID=392011 RepID=A0ABY6ZPD3_9BACL|nr:thiamine pyrophosphate-dependent dehydrogenase E1 component subunit alpha [Alicyclobacillus fastidiosus]WAH44725.1 thiamine pyrophosphate-dependent dehydrogenase E1 component subunit alpha [Alicyclobacillus fastidiosus]